jgi:cell division transport system permease protein
MNTNSFFRKFRITYLTTIISLTLLLFILGIQIFMWLATQKFSNSISENIAIELVIKTEATDPEIAKLKSTIESSAMVAKTIFISKDEAAKNFEKELGENFLEITGYNPLFSSLEVHLKPEFNSKETIASWIESNRKFAPVQEVIYKNDIAETINKYTSKANLIISAFSVLLLISALLMIYNNNRIAIFNERFSIKTMYLVGASQTYILKPFIFKAMRHSLYSIFFAMLFLFLLLNYSQNIIPELGQVTTLSIYLKLFGIITSFGLFITLISTFFAIKTVLNNNPDKIY